MASRLTERGKERRELLVMEDRPNRRAGSSARSLAEKQLWIPTSFPQEFRLKGLAAIIKIGCSACQGFRRRRPNTLIGPCPSDASAVSVQVLSCAAFKI